MMTTITKVLWMMVSYNILFFLLLGTFGTVRTAASAVNSYHPRAYVIGPEKMNWRNANKYCRTKHGTQLATITSMEENNRFMELCKNATGASDVKTKHSGQCWLGFNDINKEGNWVWPSGASSDFVYWYQGSPKKSSKTNVNDCGGQHWRDAGWIDKNCDTVSIPFICDAPATDTPASPEPLRSYIPVTHKMIWQDADQYCQTKYGTRLATIASEAENERFLDACRYAARGDPHPTPDTIGFCWMGFNDIKKEGKWAWVSGVSSRYTSWLSGEPNDSYWNFGEDCGAGHWKNPMGWVDKHCKLVSLTFVCDAPLPTRSYVAGPESMNWRNANKYCRTKYGTQLATITSMEENNRFMELCKNATGASDVESKHSGQCWLGFNDINKEGNWVWPSGTSSDFVYWYPGSPKKPSKTNVNDCGGQHWRDAGWIDKNCDTVSIPFICDAPIEITRSPTPPPSPPPTRQYIVVPVAGKMTFNEASQFCARYIGSTMATVTSKEENDRFREACKIASFEENYSSDTAGYCWLGFRYMFYSGYWYWQSAVDSDYTNWLRGEPTVTTRYYSRDACAAQHWLDPMGWVDKDCNALSLAVVCDTPKNYVPTTKAPTPQPTTRAPNLPPSILRSYIAGPSKMNWHNANKFCQTTYGTKLATITSMEENDRFMALCRVATGTSNERGHCWLGFNDIALEGKWVWASGISSDFEYWYSDEPNDAPYNNGEDCGTQHWGYPGWVDKNCDNELIPFLCDLPRTG